MEDYIEFDKLKTKVLKYALYKKEAKQKLEENLQKTLEKC